MQTAFPENAAQEKAAIRSLTEETQIKEGDTFFLLSSKWWKKWVEYVQEDCADSLEAFYFEPSGSKRPPSIDNSDLVSEDKDVEDTDSNANFQLRPALAEDRDYVLLPEKIWEALHSWYGGGPAIRRKVITTNSAEPAVEVYLLQLKILQLSGDETTVHISLKEPVHELCKKARESFGINNEIRLWKYCLRTKQRQLLDGGQTLQDASLQMGEELLLEVRANGKWPDEIKSLANGSTNAFSSVSSFSIAGGPTGSKGSSNITKHPVSSFEYSKNSWSGPLGLVGLQNLGNTCFMNSALQCLVHTPQLVNFFLEDYNKEINRDNTMGTKGELALAFGELLRRLWIPRAPAFPPRSFKTKLSRFAPQFGGFSQQDSQELLAFLLDGLHEDLNRLRTRPYTQVKDTDGRPDEEVADEFWETHRAQNDSVIVDVFQGQYKSTLVCPACSKVSVTFDPFMYLSLPLPTNTRTMTVTVITSDGSTAPKQHTVVVARQAKCRNLAQAVGNSCGLTSDEMLQLFQLRSQHLLDENIGVSSIPDNDQLVAYKLPKVPDSAPFVAFFQYHPEQKRTQDRVPFIAPLPEGGLATGREVKSIFERILSPMRIAKNESGNSDTSPFTLWSTDDRGAKSTLIELDEQFPSKVLRYTYILVEWSETAADYYDLSFLSKLPEVCKAAASKKLRQEAVSLYACLEAFLKEEPLGPNDMWECPRCKQRQQALKKLDLWRLPEILVVHLKRFSYARYQNKLETFVDFPIHDLDLTKYLSHRSNPQQHEYELYAVSNHYGSIGMGHYTAIVKLDEQWYTFDDSHVNPTNEDSVRTSAAYVLFYKRKRSQAEGEEDDLEEEAEEDVDVDVDGYEAAQQQQEIEGEQELEEEQEQELQEELPSEHHSFEVVHQQQEQRQEEEEQQQQHLEELIMQDGCSSLPCSPTFSGMDM